MPRFVAALLLQLMLFTALGVAQKPDAAPLSDGRRWRGLRDDIKLAWLVGYAEGITYSSAKNLYPKTLSYEEVRSALDRFYETPENRPIPVGMALLVIVERASGIPQSQIDDFVSSLRRQANAAPDK